MNTLTPPSRIDKKLRQEEREQEAIFFYQNTAYIGHKPVICEGTTQFGKCIRAVTARQQQFSKAVFGKILCWYCQHPNT